MAPTTQDISRVVLYASDGSTPLVTTAGIKTTVADGANVALGTKGDLAVTDPTLSATEISLLKGLLTALGTVGDGAVTNPASNGSEVALLKGLITLLAKGQQTIANSIGVTLPSNATAANSPQFQGANTTLSGTAAALNADILAATDVGAYRTLVLQLTGFGSATITVQASLDTFTTPIALNGRNVSSLSIISGITANGMYVFALPAGAQIRIRATSYSSGTIVGNIGLSAQAWDIATIAQAYSGGTAINSATPGSDSVSASLAGLMVENYNLLYDAQNTNWERARVANVFKTVSLGAATAETTIWTPTSGKKFNLMGMVLTCGAASTLTFKDNTSGTTIFVARGTTDQPIVVPQMSNGILSAAANNVLTVTRGTSCTLDGVVFGTEE